MIKWLIRLLLLPLVKQAATEIAEIIVKGFKAGFSRRRDKKTITRVVEVIDFDDNPIPLAELAGEQLNKAIKEKLSLADAASLFKGGLIELLKTHNVEYFKIGGVAFSISQIEDGTLEKYFGPWLQVSKAKYLTIAPIKEQQEITQYFGN